MEKIPRQELWEIFENLPNALKDAIFSEETAETIGNICQINKIENISVFAIIVGRTLMGLLPVKDFEEMIKYELGISPEIAKKSASEAEHYIFNPLKDDLDFIYGEGAGKRAKEETSDTQDDKPWAGPKKHAWEDTYREPVE